MAHTALASLWNLRLLPEMAADPLAFFTRLARERGGVVPFDFGMRRQWLITEPSAIKTVFLQHADDLGRDRATEGLSPLLGQGLVTSHGATWKRRRKAAAPAFTPAQVRLYADVMVAEAAVDAPREGPVDVYAAMTDIASRVILRVMFGEASEGGLDILDAVQAYISLNEQEFMTFRRFLPAFASTPGRRQGAISRAIIADRLAPLIAARRAAPGGDDILSRLVDARDADGAGLSDDELCDEVATLIFAGFETSAATLGFALPLLAARPDVQDALAAERAAVLGDRAPTAEDARRLVHHAAVVDETLRLYPAVWGLGRRVLRTFEVNGHRLEAGHQLNASAWVVHRDPQWWDAPDAFRPERFLNGGVGQGNTFIPYGVGPRVCIGQHFAKMESVLVMARWLAGRRLRPIEGQELTCATGVLLRPASGTRVHVEVAA